MGKSGRRGYQHTEADDDEDLELHLELDILEYELAQEKKQRAPARRRAPKAKTKGSKTASNKRLKSEEDLLFDELEAELLNEPQAASPTPLRDASPANDNPHDDPTDPGDVINNDSDFDETLDSDHPDLEGLEDAGFAGFAPDPIRAEPDDEHMPMDPYADVDAG